MVTSRLSFERVVHVLLLGALDDQGAKNQHVHEFHPFVPGGDDIVVLIPRVLAMRPAQAKACIRAVRRQDERLHLLTVVASEEVALLRAVRSCAMVREAEALQLGDGRVHIQLVDQFVHDGIVVLAEGACAWCLHMLLYVSRGGVKKYGFVLKLF